MAQLTGAGFEAGESVTLLVTRFQGPQSTAPGHAPWTVTAESDGSFVTDWQVCDDCVGLLLVASADGDVGSHGDTSFTENHNCGDGIVTSIVPVGGACSAFTPAVGNGPDNYEVQEGGTYVITISGVTECTDDTITVFVQGSSTGNFCFNATGGAGTYSGEFTMPAQACFTYPISYKCGASAPCSHPNSYAARGPTSACGGVHLRASFFDGSCNPTGEDSVCTCTPCSLVPPQDSVVECGDPIDPSSTGSPTGCSDATHDDEVSASCGGTYVITRTWSADDGCGGTATAVQTITVSDTTPPTVGTPADIAIDCGDSTEPSNTGEPTPGDDCSGISDVDHSDSIAPGECAGTYVITRTWTVTDACGNTEEGEQTITVTDTTGPEIQCPENLDLTGCCVTPDIGQATAEDDCSGVESITNDAPEVFCTGDTLVTWTARDHCGNESTCQQMISVRDVTLSFEGDGANVTLLHGQSLVTVGPETPFACPTLTSGPDPATPGNGNNGVSVFDSTNGPFGADPDLNVGQGMILYCQRNGGPTDDFTGINGPDTWDHPNDDEDGGSLVFDFCGGVEPLSIDLIDIDPGVVQSALVILTDSFTLTRTYTVPGGWTTDGPGPTAVRNLLLNAVGVQIGDTANASEATDAGFDPTDVVKIEVRLGSSGAIDNLRYCPPKAAVEARNGSGINPNLLTANGMPILGAPWSATLDCSAYGNGLAVLAVRRLPAAGQITMAGEVLIGGDLLHRAVIPYAQASTRLAWDIPYDMSLCGIEYHVQGMCQVTSFAPGVPKVKRVRKQLSNALDLVLGF